MRLTKREAHKAKAELMELLKKNPFGLRTSPMQGTRKFHGARTLSLRQIARLLREIPGVEHDYEGYGYMAASWWRLTPEQKIAATGREAAA